MKTPEQIAADSAAEAAENALKPAQSFRGDVETALQGLHDRVSKCEAIGGAVDDQGNSLAGMIRTFDARIQQVETIQAENTSQILRLSELVQTQLGGLASRIGAAETALKAPAPAPQQ